MRNNFSRCAFLAALLFAAPLFADDFQNLDFSQGTSQSPPANYVPADAVFAISASAALPHWTVKEDNTVCNAIWAVHPLDETGVRLATGNGIPGTSVRLSAFSEMGPPYYRSASISQVGLVPFGVKSIRFSIAIDAGSVGAPILPTITLNGVTVNYVSLGPPTDGVTMMAGDVSAFAGTNAELKFQEGLVPPQSQFYDAGVSVGAISFSSVPAPEPGVLMIAILPVIWALISRAGRDRSSA
jgi:hypothetical protein